MLKSTKLTFCFHSSPTSLGSRIFFSMPYSQTSSISTPSPHVRGPKRPPPLLLVRITALTTPVEARNSPNKVKLQINFEMDNNQCKTLKTNNQNTFSAEAYTHVIRLPSHSTHKLYTQAQRGKLQAHIALNAAAAWRCQKLNQPTTRNNEVRATPRPQRTVTEAETSFKPKGKFRVTTKQDGGRTQPLLKCRADRMKNPVA
jgi:hypothetical protein